MISHRQRDVTFDEYLQTVSQEFSKSVASREVLERTKSAFDETVYDLFHRAITEEKAVVIMESFYSKFRNHLKNID